MKDRISMVLAFLGFVLVAVVVIVNYRSRENTVYEIEAGYKPVHRNDLQSSYELYQQLTGARSIACPETSLTVSKDVVSMIHVTGSGSHRYHMTSMFVPRSVVMGDEIKSPGIDDWSSVLKLSDAAGSSDTQRMFDLFTGVAFEENTLIIAPFSFSYGNLNSDVKTDKDTGETVQDIVIYNSDKSCRITFSNVANWFCAGSPGTSTQTSTKVDGSTSWEDHYKVHHSVIGNSPNATCTGGISGSVLGYATSETTIKIEAFNGTAYQSISLNKFIQP